MLREILPGVYHWTVVWPDDYALESYRLITPQGGVLIDPMDYRVPVEDVIGIVITSAHHERSAQVFARESGAPIYVPESGAHSFEDVEGIRTYGHGDTLPGQLGAIEVPGRRGTEMASLSPVHGGTLIVGDALGTMGKWTPDGAPLGGHPANHPDPSKSLAYLLD